MNELTGAFEAVLFASGEPVSMESLKEILGIDAENVRELAAAYSKQLEERGSGLQLQQIAGGWQLATNMDYYDYVQRLGEERDKHLSQAAMETLSIVAFKQPITKQEIEHIRGVRIEKIMSRLLEMELIRELGRKDTIGRPILYGTTDTFLQCFGLKDLGDLPELPAPDTNSLTQEQMILFQEQSE